MGVLAGNVMSDLTGVLMGDLMGDIMEDLINTILGPVTYWSFKEAKIREVHPDRGFLDKKNSSLMSLKIVHALYGMRGMHALYDI